MPHTPQHRHPEHTRGSDHARRQRAERDREQHLRVQCASTAPVEYELSGSDNRLVSNLFYANGRAPTYLPDGRIKESVSYAGNPRFLNLDRADLRLGPASLALNRADPNFSRPFDFRGRKRPRGAAADLGAFER